MTSIGLVLARKRTQASRNLVWSFITDDKLRHHWWPGSHVDARITGAVTEQSREDAAPGARDATGTVDVCIEGHAVGFRWRNLSDETETDVLITLRSGDAGTEVTVTETGFGRFSDAYARVAAGQQRWIDRLTSLVSVLAEDPEPEAPKPEVEVEGTNETEPAPEPSPEQDDVPKPELDFDTLIREAIADR